MLLTKALSTFLHVFLHLNHIYAFFLTELGLIRIENMENKNTEVFAKTLDFDDMLVR